MPKNRKSILCGIGDTSIGAVYMFYIMVFIILMWVAFGLPMVVTGVLGWKLGKSLALSLLIFGVSMFLYFLYESSQPY